MVVTAACCLPALVHVGSPDRPVRTIVPSLRATASAGETVELEVRNVSSGPSRPTGCGNRGSCGSWLERASTNSWPSFTST